MLFPLRSLVRPGLLPQPALLWLARSRLKRLWLGRLASWLSVYVGIAWGLLLVLLRGDSGYDTVAILHASSRESADAVAGRVERAFSYTDAPVESRPPVLDILYGP